MVAPHLMVGNPAAALDGGLFSGEVVGPLPFGANEGVAGAACQKQGRHREHERVAGVELAVMVCFHGWMGVLPIPTCAILASGPQSRRHFFWCPAHWRLK